MGEGLGGEEGRNKAVGVYYMRIKKRKKKPSGCWSRGPLETLPHRNTPLTIQQILMVTPYCWSQDMGIQVGVGPGYFVPAGWLALIVLDAGQAAARGKSSDTLPSCGPVNHITMATLVRYAQRHERYGSKQVLPDGI